MRDLLASLARATEDRLRLGSTWSTWRSRTAAPRDRWGLALWGTIFILFIVEALTGIALATTYVPTATDAWGSIFYIQEEMTLGALVRGLHYHGGALLVVLTSLQLVQMVFQAGYRRPNEVPWFVACLLLLICMAFGLTGYVLPWDQAGYWANQTELNVMETVPGGSWIRQLLAGGDTTGNQTLSRFFAIHAFVLPAVTVFLMWIRSRATAIQHRQTKSPDTPVHLTGGPTQFFWTLTLSLIALAALFLLTLTLGVTLDAPADPSTVFEARPKWYFLFLFKLLQYVEGPAAILATVVFPMLALGFLLSLPFLDRSHGDSRPPRRVWIPFSMLCLLVVGLTTVALVDDARNPEYQAARASAADEANLAIKLAKQGGINANGKVVLFEGLKLFKQKGCVSCHARDAEEKPSPLLGGYGSLKRIQRFLADPNHKDFFGATVLRGEMASFVGEYGTQAELDVTAAWLLSLAGGAIARPDDVRKGEKFFREGECIYCHNDPAIEIDARTCWQAADDCDDDVYRAQIVGPDLKGYQNYEWTRGLIINSAHPTYFGGAFDPAKRDRSMPGYPDLAPSELDLLTRWLLAGAPGADE